LKRSKAIGLIALILCPIFIGACYALIKLSPIAAAVVMLFLAISALRGWQKGRKTNEVTNEATDKVV